MNIIASHLRVNKYGVIFRVSVGAALSSIDAATDIYVITTYYQSYALIGQARALLAMISTNLVMQIIVVLGQYKKKSFTFKLKEVLITLLMLRPVVDAYQVSTNHKDEDATESIPGCVLQLYVWFMSPEEAGSLALVSIGIGAMCTGFASAMISFDIDIGVTRRKDQPNFFWLPPR